MSVAGVGLVTPVPPPASFLARWTPVLRRIATDGLVNVVTLVGGSAFLLW